LKKSLDDREVLVVRPRRARAPLGVQELLEALRADRRLEVLELEVGEVAGELVEPGLVVAVGAVGQPLALDPQVAGDLLPRGRSW
jgi:hypothetical protein